MPFISSKHPPTSFPMEVTLIKDASFSEEWATFKWELSFTENSFRIKPVFVQKINI